jgi:stage II sporulation protein D
VKDTDGAGRPWCAGSRHASWEECWPRAEFAAAVLRGLPEVAPAARGIALGRLRDIEIARRSPSGRAEELRVETDAGWFSVPGERIRGLLSRPGGGPLRSTLLGRLKLEEGEGGRICLDGRGNGHGVGMCQSGALEMARRGRSPEEILRHYYRGIGFARWW